MPIVTHIKRISHVAVKMRDVAAQTQFYTQVVGLGKTTTGKDGWVYLRCNGDHHTHVLVPSKKETGFDHYAYEVVDLHAAADALAKAGIPFEEYEGSVGHGTAIRLRDPVGNCVELIEGMKQVPPKYGVRAVQPRRLSHFASLAKDCKTIAEWYIEVLGFRLSDRLNHDFYWLRVNPDHHTLSFIKGDEDRLHHICYEVGDMGDLVRQADHLKDNGRALLYGPGRHGPDRTLFLYFRDPEDNVIEFGTDTVQIWDEKKWKPRVWDPNKPWINIWGIDPPPDF